MDEVLGDYVKSRSDWTVSRFSNRLDEIKSKLQAHDSEQNKLSASQLARAIAEEARLSKLLTFCRQLSEDDVPAAHAAKPKKRARSPESTKKNAAQSEKKAKRSSKPKPERSIERQVEDVQFIKKDCLHCRAFGHVLKNCPLLAKPGQPISQKTICWRCGQEDHTLPECKEAVNEENPLPYARCFICGEAGHLSARCEQNPNGIYPKGGSCYRCGSIYHLAKDCEMREEKIEEKRKNRFDKRHRKDESVTQPPSRPNADARSGRPVVRNKGPAKRFERRDFAANKPQSDARRPWSAANKPLSGANKPQSDANKPQSTTRPFDLEKGRIKRPRGTKGGKQVQARRKLAAMRGDKFKR